MTLGARRQAWMTDAVQFAIGLIDRIVVATVAPRLHRAADSAVGKGHQIDAKQLRPTLDHRCCAVPLQGLLRVARLQHIEQCVPELGRGRIAQQVSDAGNEFAHSRRSFGFSTPEVAEFCKHLKSPDWPSVLIPKAYLDTAPHEELASAIDKQHTKTRYVTACHNIAEHLLQNTQQAAIHGIAVPDLR